MTEKAVIVEELGQGELLLPRRVEHALLANDQVKYLFALLQEARSQADSPHRRHPDLAGERVTAGLDDASLDHVVRGTRRTDGDAYLVPGIQALLARIDECMERMIAAVPEADRPVYRGRLDALRPSPAPDGTVRGAQIDAMTSGDRAAHDSLHVLVMDLHRAINRVQASLAQESIDGASAYDLSERSRRLVRAFMSGLNRTAPLRFDHPGLGTTATDSRGQLLLQNDIGMTDSHVIVIRVSGLETRVTYTDVHLRRLEFFEEMFEAFPVRWEQASTHDSETLVENRYFLVTGIHDAADEKDLERFLRHLGSRLVFLIDWNKARRQLRSFVKGSDALKILQWAAEHDVGHRAFLEIGGENAIYEAMSFAGGAELRVGDRLADLVGRDRAIEYLQFALERATSGLRAGRGERLILDELKAELLRHVRTVEEDILEIGLRHASVIHELADAVRTGLAVAQAEPGSPAIARTADRCTGWERRADDLLNQARSEARRTGKALALVRVLEEADDVADALEDASFHLTLLSRCSPPAALFPPVQRLATLVVDGSRAWVQCLSAAAHVGRSSARDGMEDVLAGVDRITRIEHDADATLRTVTSDAITAAADFRQLHVVTELAKVLEDSTDALLRGTAKLREHLLEEVMRA